jgi:serine/threonine-protein kinase
MPQLCTLILHQDPPSPRSIRPELPEAIEAVIMRCLRKDRAQRYPNVGALARDLAGFAPDAGPRSAERISKVLSSSGMSSTELSSSNLSAHTAASNTGSQAWGATQVSRGNRAVWLGGLGVVALLAVGFLVWKGSAGSGPAPSPEASAATVTKPPAEVPTPAAAPLPAPTPVPPAATSESPAAPAASSAAPVAKPHVAPRPVGGKPKPGAGKPEPGVDPLSERN